MDCGIYPRQIKRLKYLFLCSQILKTQFFLTTLDVDLVYTIIVAMNTIYNCRGQLIYLRLFRVSNTHFKFSDFEIIFIFSNVFGC
jgi:hypothetical protein